MSGTTTVAAVCALAALTALGCESNRGTDPMPAEDEVVVFAAASLREAFVAIGDAFERAHPGVDVVFNFAGTQELRTQAEHGARADVFASADLRHMQGLVDEGLVSSPRVFARNTLAIVTTRERAADLRDLADLPSARRIVIGGPEVPVGRYTAKALELASDALGADFRARLEARIVSRELSVRQVLAKVRLGEADAGIVYRTDAWPARHEVGVVELPDAVQVSADYPIAAMRDAPHPTLAAAFVAFVLSDEGQRPLAEHGFIAMPTVSSASNTP
jgi:molybdate transport system substrate-binding protein